MRKLLQARSRAEAVRRRRRDLRLRRETRSEKNYRWARKVNLIVPRGNYGWQTSRTRHFHDDAPVSLPERLFIDRQQERMTVRIERSALLESQGLIGLVAQALLNAVFRTRSSMLFPRYDPMLYAPELDLEQLPQEIP